ncbi:hypothetical protein AAVH_23708 [Aphelenchoides avenae]|nr:hypothetical protein AAVH_23708 [Aphelenchus avenae]
MDDEIISFCKKKSPQDRHRSVAFSSVTATKDLFRKIVQMRINDELPEAFALRIICPYNNPQQDLGVFQAVLEHPGGWGGTYAVKGTDLKLRHDSDDERDYRDAEIWNYSYSEEKYATDSG